LLEKTKSILLCLFKFKCSIAEKAEHTELRVGSPFVSEGAKFICLMDHAGQMRAFGSQSLGKYRKTNQSESMFVFSAIPSATPLSRIYDFGLVSFPPFSAPPRLHFPPTASLCTVAPTAMIHFEVPPLPPTLPIPLRYAMSVVFLVSNLCLINLLQYPSIILTLLSREAFLTYMKQCKKLFACFLVLYSQVFAPSELVFTGFDVLNAPPETVIISPNHQIYSDWLYIWYLASPHLSSPVY
jgi:hypothetical protein